LLRDGARALRDAPGLQIVPRCGGHPPGIDAEMRSKVLSSAASTAGTIDGDNSLRRQSARSSSWSEAIS
jgi:hypothetical protein